MAHLRRGGPAAEEGGELALLRAEGLLQLPVPPLGGLDGVVPLLDGDPDILDVPELHDHAAEGPGRVRDGQDGGHQIIAVDLAGDVPEFSDLAGHHLVQVPLEQRPLEELPEVVARHLHLGAGALAGEGGAPQQAADAFFPGGVALFLPEFHLAGGAVQSHQLADAPEVVDDVGGLPHGDGGGPGVDGYPDGDVPPDGGQLQHGGVAAGQKFVDRLAARRVILAHRRQPVPGPELPVPDIQPLQIGGGEAAVVGADGGVGDDDQISGLQLPGAVGILAVVEQAEVVLGLLVDMGDGALPVQGEHGLGGGLHHALQQVYVPHSSLSPQTGTTNSHFIPYRQCKFFCSICQALENSGECPSARFMIFSERNAGGVIHRASARVLVLP